MSLVPRDLTPVARATWQKGVGARRWQLPAWVDQQLQDFAYRELRYNLLAKEAPERAAHLLRQAQASLEESYRVYEDLAARDGSRFLPNWEEA